MNAKAEIVNDSLVVSLSEKEVKYPLDEGNTGYWIAMAIQDANKLGYKGIVLG